MSKRVAFGLAASLLVACGGGTQTNGHPDGGTDAGVTDGGATDGGQVDGGTDGGASGTLTAIDPAAGALAGGTAVEVRGTGFVDGLTVTLGGDACTGLVVISTTRASCTTPAHATAEAVDVTATWPGGATDTLPGAFTYQSAPPATVGYAQLFQPATDATVVGGGTVTVSAQVYVDLVTGGAGQGGGVQAQVGFGPATADPSTSPGAFTFTALTYTGDADGLTPGDKANDVYGGDLAAPATDGSYRLAVRFSLDGTTWTYADRTGTADGFAATDLPTVTVSNTTAVAVDYCELHYPSALLGAPGQRTDLVYGWVYTLGVTDQAGQAAGITAQLGVGDTGTDPTSDASWTFVNAAYNTDANNGANDEYMAALTAPATPGAHDYAYRFSGDGGQTWTYCDLPDPTGGAGGSTNGYASANAGKLTVMTPTVDYCELHSPATLTGTAGQTTGLTVHGWVYKQGDTETGSQGLYIEAELGLGGHGSDPTAAPATWTWFSANYNGKAPGQPNNDEYMGDVTAPGTAGTYDYAYRFRIQGSSTWTYCDLPGTPGGSTDGYSAANAGVLTVQ